MYLHIRQMCVSKPTTENRNLMKHLSTLTKLLIIATVTTNKSRNQAKPSKRNAISIVTPAFTESRDYEFQMAWGL